MKKNQIGWGVKISYSISSVAIVMIRRITNPTENRWVPYIIRAEDKLQGNSKNTYSENRDANINNPCK